ncbi:hypothetical protein G4Y79_03235 [Phototrophicus methaneseepsis]|uniref:CARDB domain-containing protein n=1 Tax=Phototrophicus methaneseepsis TaxID=2710758 RepID=A0A7S8EAI5_9CHLR|nr:CARDB domain-containing protein [Phototrophicus methaneseepsis]QPC83410.1 hypothetical protein G4Y79_03235 [Phototrophicus methaneseepsis]
MENPMYRRGFRYLLLLVALSLLAACSPTDEPENEPIAFEGPPVVRIISPAPNATYLKDASVVISTRIENAGPDVATVALSINGVNIGTTDASSQTAAAFSVETGWPATVPGTYTLEVIATREDGTASEPASVTFNVQDSINPQGEDEATEEPTEEAQEDTTPETPTEEVDTQTIEDPATATPQPTDIPSEPVEEPATQPPPATATPSYPTATTIQGANIRSGPSTAFEPPLGSIGANETRRILARNTDSSWFRIEVFNSSGWIAAFLVETSGDIASLPVENPAPPAPTATPQPTAVPAQVDLSIVDWSTSPGQPTCNQPSTTRITIANSGTSASTQTNVVLRDLYNGEVQANSSATIPALQPGQNTTVTIDLSVSTYFAQVHTFRAVIDPDNAIPETNEDNNSRQFDYVLKQGSC